MVSVIVPVYNVAEFVGPCLASLQAQTFPRFEAIVVDDGSTDDSRARVAAAIAGDARFRVFAGPNGGLSAARNIGLAMARGRFIAFLDGDDRFAPTFLESMMGALTSSGADWVACGLSYVQAGADSGPTHSGIHSKPVLNPELGLTARDLGDWRDVVEHFPSAWNKLYRAELIAGLTFDLGTYYEDHAFFWQVAARSPTLMHLPQALYLNTAGRAGQITRDGGERVFEQFAVLDRLRGLLDEVAHREGGVEAFERVALRLVRERGAVITDPARLARFADHARAYFIAHGVEWQSRLEQEGAKLGRFERALLGRRALCVVLPSNGKFEPLRDSLVSLARQHIWDFDVVIVSDGQAKVSALARAAESAGMDWRVSILGPDVRCALPTSVATERVAHARNRGLAAANADFVVFLDAGDLLLPETLGAWLEHMMASGADMGFSAYCIGSRDGLVHGGVHDEAPFAASGLIAGPEAALALHALPSGKIFRRAHLVDYDLHFPAHSLQTWQLLLEAAAHGTTVRLPGAGAVQGEAAEARSFWRGPAPEPEDLVRDLDTLLGRLPPGWLGPQQALQLLARAIWERFYFARFADNSQKAVWANRARDLWLERSRGVPDRAHVFDPYVSEAFRGFLCSAGDLP